MARLERPQNENPATMFLHWKSNDKCFEYYDKEAEEKVKVKLPLKVLFMEHYHTVKGWNNASKSGIYSNEVYSIGTAELTVASFKGGEIAKGLYKEIKNKVNQAGGKYYRSIYCMTEDGKLINLQLKGSAVSNYSDFYKENHHLLDNQWIVISKAEEGKKGSIKYTKPFFEIGDIISRESDKQANEVAKILQDYMDRYTAKDKAEDIEVNEPELVSDELDF